MHGTARRRCAPVARSLAWYSLGARVRRKNDSVKLQACIGAPVRYTGTKPCSLIAKERRENASTGRLKEGRVGTRAQGFGGEESKEQERKRVSGKLAGKNRGGGGGEEGK